MAYYSGVDVVDCTYNSQDLKAFVMGIEGLEIEEGMTEWRAPGSAYKTRDLTGQFTVTDPVIHFIYDGTATGPCVKCAASTSATLTITLVSGQSFTGTALVRKRTVTIPEEGDDTFDVEFAWTGTVTVDLAA